MEKRKTAISSLTALATSLPTDYLEMVTETFTTHFEEGLKILEPHQTESQFEAFGEVYADEILVALSLFGKGNLSATTVYASCDFDPKASAPTAEELLSACIDAIGSVFGFLLVPEKPEIIAQLASKSLSSLASLPSLENIPFDWTKIEADQREIFVKIDKSNPKLDSLADEWIKNPESKMVH